MKTITVAELRQNPTAALAEVEAGETYVVTKHRREIARLVPPDPDETRLGLITARNPGNSQLARRSREELHTYDETEALLDEMASDW